MAATRSRIAVLTWFALATALGTGCDLSTKAWAERSLGQGTQTIIDPWVGLQLAYNRGTAFSVFRDLDSGMWILAGLALLIAALIAGFVLKMRPGRLETLALASIVAGALGNGFDRAFRAAPGGGTGVVDFISITLPWGSRWPTFNVADVLLVLGVGVLLVRGLTARREPPTVEPQPA